MTFQSGLDVPYSILSGLKRDLDVTEFDTREAQGVSWRPKIRSSRDSSVPLASQNLICGRLNSALGVPIFDLGRLERDLGVPEFDLERLKSALGAPEFDLEKLKKALEVTNLDERALGVP